MLLLIDNYDSFTFNLAQYFAVLGEEVRVERNDALSLADIEALAPARIVISPGPGTPAAAGISLAVIRAFAKRLPLLGVCLGHQALAEAFGGRIVHAPTLVHGKTSPVHHDGRGIFEGLPSPLAATRYHSLCVEESSLPQCLEVSAWTGEGDLRVIMGLRHRSLDLEGVQFHPEAILTEHGMALLGNWLAGKRACRNQPGNPE
ncbi:MAG: aminodeoxychorismate/anthranilate synthase component II [Planctomycetaceae bacterium]|nr:Aminodeoxychorismate synthase component 2 [Planctomycetota bacterium]MCQ3948726.1 anthranilate/aminodeoxychorismate synthase component II [Planctomycetota bacterium]NUO17719.1 aminodeoxychorismate/anthranilate synthase component II [Planctomycetaceae bacterium]GIK52791.1 MAG: glutamine amidotransferase [Planctomycetota bacterium]HRJ79996.1 aminodeoxychorismate/anthranilate synthase component II [Planctomycetota bacterium]